MNYDHMKAAYLRRLEDEGEFCDEHDEWFIDYCPECDDEPVTERTEK